MGDGASASLAAALCGFVLILALGVAHGYGVMNGHDAVPAYIAAFLLPLVSGALSQLLPVWCYPGRRSAVRDRMREALVRAGALRAVLFVAGGVLLALGLGAGLWLSLAALLVFLCALASAFVVRGEI